MVFQWASIVAVEQQSDCDPGVQCLYTRRADGNGR